MPDSPNSYPDLLKNTLGIVLAGGQGERLYPLTRNRAKPAVPFGGSYRIIDFTLSNCLNSGLRKIVVLTQYKSLSLNRHLGLGWSFFNRELGEYLDVIPPQQRTVTGFYSGTADAIFQNIYTLERERPSCVLVLSGDHVYKMDYRPMLHAHIQKNAVLTVACVVVEKERASSFGIAEVDDEGRMVGFEEKPENPKHLPGDPDHCLASMGVYVFTTEMLVRKVVQDAKSDTAHDFGKDVIPAMVGREAVYAWRFGSREKPEYWRDIGLLDAYYEANMDLLASPSPFELRDESWPVRTYREQRHPAKFVSAGGESSVMDSIVCDGCVVRGRVVHSVLSPGVEVCEGSVVEGCIIASDVVVGRSVHLSRVVVDKQVRIPEGERIGFDAEADARRFKVTSGGVVVIPAEVPFWRQRR